MLSSSGVESCFSLVGNFLIYLLLVYSNMMFLYNFNVLRVVIMVGIFSYVIRILLKNFVSKLSSKVVI